MRVYVVREGDTAEKIAAMDEHASCPKCSRDLVLANPHRKHHCHPNGYLSFTEPLVVGERLWLPDKWFSGELDELPRDYFDALPAPTGLGQLPPERKTMYPLALRPVGVAGCATTNGCGVPYGTPMGPYSLQYGLSQATPPPAAPITFGSLLARLPSFWPWVGLAVGGTMAITGIALMTSKKAATNPRRR